MGFLHSKQRPSYVLSGRTSVNSIRLPRQFGYGHFTPTVKGENVIASRVPNYMCPGPYDCRENCSYAPPRSSSHR